MRILVIIATALMLCFGVATAASAKNEGHGQQSEKPQKAEKQEKAKKAKKAKKKAGEDEEREVQNPNANPQWGEDAKRGQERATERRSEQGAAHEQAGQHMQEGMGEMQGHMQEGMGEMHEHMEKHSEMGPGQHQQQEQQTEQEQTGTDGDTP